MKNIVTVLFVVALGWYAIQKYESYEPEILSDTPKNPTVDPDREKTNTPKSVNRLKCDGRTHCSEMTSCEEAKFFIRNCPNTEMDGDNDHIPCERQWCN